ncbi:hypothetical protein MJG53_009174 [Ovis ammon polii x Ovis aries]|uniref:Uncharacterized protein n=1 Tax=Ovis ammon polii x Ovis aries TaxID=2918886 RepID=A0ACB9UYW0_9CETA|nr:hypothetical protein MJG53_009174 [Ovis ammon polii x Ovis aries]
MSHEGLHCMTCSSTNSGQAEAKQSHTEMEEDVVKYLANIPEWEKAFYTRLKLGNGTFGPDLFPSCVISASPTSVQSVSSADDAVVPTGIPTKGFGATGGEVVCVTQIETVHELGKALQSTMEEKVVDARASSLSGADDNMDSVLVPDSGTWGPGWIGAQTKTEPGDLMGMTYLLRKDFGEKNGE